MLLQDAFRAFDYDRNGRLSCAELYGGITWLGLEMQATELVAIVENLHLSTYNLQVRARLYTHHVL